MCVRERERERDSVRLKRSTGFPLGWDGVVLVLWIPAISHSSFIVRDSKSCPCSLFFQDSIVNEKVIP